MITMIVPPDLYERLCKFIEDNNYCPFCDSHPSSGHVLRCPMQPEFAHKRVSPDATAV